MADPILFDRGIPSNFYRQAPIRLPHVLSGGREVTYPTTEHYFQAYKLRLVSIIFQDQQEQWDLFDAILSDPSPGTAKRIGHDIPLEPEAIKAWDESIAVLAMLQCSLAKYQQHQHCRQWLLQTGDAPLVEHRPDKIWGDGLDGSGKNLLGKVLEVVRATLR